MPTTPSTRPSTPHAIVIGGGLAGLASAAELRSHGVRVTLVERNAHLGGKMNVLSDRGFTFDMGPTILTMPDVLRGIITRSGRRVKDCIDLVRLEPQWRCLYEDGTKIDLLGDVDAMAAAMDRQFPNASGIGAGWKSFVEYSRRMYRLSDRVFFYKDLGGVADMMRTKPPAELGLLRDIAAMRMHSTMAKTANLWLREPHLLQLSEHFLQYVGSSPFLAPAILTLIAAAQVDHGCWYAMGGTRMVARSLERILRESEPSECEIITGTGVARVLHDGDRAAGVLLDDGRRIMADAVISNCDVQRTYRSLLGDPASMHEQRRIAKDFTPACSGIVLYLGLKRQYDHLLHHDFLFSRESSVEFGEIYGKGEPTSDPTLYLCVPSRTDPSQAPEGCESLYVLVHAPYLRSHHDWDSEAKDGLFARYRRLILDKMKRFGMEDIEDQIVVERRLTPRDIDRMYNAEGGAIYGLASHGRLKGGFKPRNRSRVLKNLYLAGGSANPGPGVPMVLMSGVTAAWSLLDDQGVRVNRSSTHGEELADALGASGGGTARQEAACMTGATN